MRLMYVSAFAVGAYVSSERTYKPFNPILGETFEFETPSYFYVAEQARSGHPPLASVPSHHCTAISSLSQSPLTSPLPLPSLRCPTTRPWAPATPRARGGPTISPRLPGRSSSGITSTCSPLDAPASRSETRQALSPLHASLVLSSLFTSYECPAQSSRTCAQPLLQRWALAWVRGAVG